MKKTHRGDQREDSDRSPPTPWSRRTTITALFDTEARFTHVNGIVGKQGGFTIDRLGCPLISAIAIVLARTTHEPITIDAVETSNDGKDIEAWYGLLET